MREERERRERERERRERERERENSSTIQTISNYIFNIFVCREKNFYATNIDFSVSVSKNSQQPETKKTKTLLVYAQAFSKCEINQKAKSLLYMSDIREFRQKDNFLPLVTYRRKCLTFLVHFFI